MKKRMLLLVVLVLAAVMLAGCGSKEKLKLFLPGAYHSDEVIRDFEKEFNCKVIIEEFDSNEIGRAHV